MNENVLRRFSWLAGVLLLGAGLGALVLGGFFGQEPGDYQVRQGDQHLSDGNYDEALSWFDRALEVTPNHRGALMGRALVFIQQEDYEKALEQLDKTINHLRRTLPADRLDDPTGYGVLASAYANKGIVKDRLGEYEEALEYYIRGLETDEGALGGPSLIHEILYGYRPSSVRDRAEYIARQLQKPEEERVMRIPEKDRLQRMHKP